MSGESGGMMWFRRGSERGAGTDLWVHPCIGLRSALRGVAAKCRGEAGGGGGSGLTQGVRT